MSNGFEEEYRYMESGQWAEVNPSRCPCGGRGFVLSDLDTWHRCPIHGKDVPHPETEMEGEPMPAFDRAAHRLQNLRSALLTFQDEAVGHGMTAAAFRKAVEAHNPQNPQEWVDVAEEVAIDARHYLEAQADNDRYMRGFND